MITVNNKPTPQEFNGYRKGTLIQANSEVLGARNIYLVLEDAPHGSNIHCIRLVVNGSAGSGDNRLFEVCHYVDYSLVELFHGELVIKNG